MEPGCWDTSELVTDQENEELEKTFSEAEIKDVVFSMEKNSAPGLDNFPVNFINNVGR